MALSYNNKYSDGAAASEYTFSGISIGSAASDRWVIITAFGGGGASVALSGITIGGSAATIFENTLSVSGMRLGVGARKVTTGTTCDIVVTFANTQSRAGIGVWIWNGNDLQLLDTDGNSTTASNPSISLSVNVSNGGFVISNAGTGDVSNSSPSWSGVSANFNDNIESNVRHYGASASGLSAETPRTIGLSVTSASMLLGQAAYSFKPAESSITSETATLEESVSTLRSRNFSAAESANLTESISVVLGKTINILETVGVSEAVSTKRSLVASILDSVGITEVLIKLKKKCTNVNKNSASPTNSSKNSSTWTNRGKS